MTFGMHDAEWYLNNRYYETPTHKVDDPERCPWCGKDCDDPTVGRGDQVNITRYGEWLEDHVLDCEPYQEESATDG